MVFTDKTRETTDLWASTFLSTFKKVWGRTRFGGRRRTQETAVRCPETSVQTQP